MAEDGSWPMIERYGLLSVIALLDLFQMEADVKSKLSLEHRPEKFKLSSPLIGSAVLRDQKPMSDASLRGCLKDGLSPQDWYLHLNSRVFLWPSEQRLQKLLNARPYRNDQHIVLTIDTESLLREYENVVELSPMNSGTSIPWKHPRGLDTFKKIADYPFDQRKKYGKDAVVELVIPHSVPNIADHVVRVELRRGADQLGLLP